MKRKLEIAMYSIISFTFIPLFISIIPHLKNLLLLLVGVAAFFFFNFIYRKLRQYNLYVNWWVLLAGISVYSIILVLVTISFGNNWIGVGQADYSYVYSSALEMSKNESLSAESYFLDYSNNIKPTIILSLLMRLFILLGMNDPYWGLLAISILLVISSLISSLYLCKDKYLRIFILLLFFSCLPIFLFSSAFYTDTMSFGCGIISIALLEASEKRKKGWFFLFFFSAFILTVSCMVKITVCIMPIAYLIIMFLNSPDTKKQIRTATLYLILILGLIILGELHFNTYPIYEKGKEAGNPAIAWIGLGLKNEGNWQSGYDYINEITSLETKQEKKSMVLNYIIDNRREFINPHHIISKFHTNFADGTMGVKYFLPTQDDTTYFHPLSQMFGNSGKYYWITTAFCYIYMYMLYSGLFISSLVALIKRIRNKDMTSTIEICHLSFFGITLFLMLWEANSRQLYNQIPTMILGCCLSLKLLGETTKPLHKKQYPSDVQLLT